MSIRKCPSCGREVVGRSDKKFCSDECRVFYNNALRKKRRSRNARLIKSIISDIREMDNADAKFLLKILGRISKVFKILSTFAKTRNDGI